MNRYAWNRSLTEAFNFMSLRGILYDRAAASAMRAALEPAVWERQAAVDALAGVTLPPSTDALLSAAGAQYCHATRLKRALAGYIERVPLNNEDGTPRLNKGGKRMHEKRAVAPRALTWTLLRETANQDGPLALTRLRDLAEAEPTPAGRAEIASLLAIGINVESPDQVIAALDRLGLPAKWKRGARIADDPDAGRTSDEEALLDVFMRTGHAFPRAVLEARAARGSLSWLDTTLPSEDGRMRCTFNASVTGAGGLSETGRVLTRQWYDGSGGNLQATASAFKPLFAADPGRRLASIDLRAADAWTAAARCAQLGDPTMLRDLQAGVRIPSVIALLIAGAAIPADHHELAALCKTVKRDWRDVAYKKGTYLSFYMGSSALIRRETVRESWAETGTPIDPGLEFCATVQRRVLERYPGLRKWWDECERAVRRDGTLRGASGQVREFLSRRWSGSGALRRLDHATLKEVVASEPQMVTTYATNLALWRLWTDPANRDERGAQSICPRCFGTGADERETIEGCATCSGRGRCGSLIVEPLLHVHDALLIQFPADRVAWAGAKIREWFANPIRIGSVVVTIPAVGGHGPNWGECNEPFPAT